MCDIEDKAEPMAGPNHLGAEFGEPVMHGGAGLEIANFIRRIMDELQVPQTALVRFLQPLQLAISIGIWHFFPSLDRYVDGIKEMADIVGVDHVSIGTDQHVTPGAVQDYTQWVALVAAMLRGGFTPEEAGKIAGGNYMRIFPAAVG